VTGVVLFELFLLLLGVMVGRMWQLTRDRAELRRRAAAVQYVARRANTIMNHQRLVAQEAIEAMAAEIRMRQP
jgi:hypothetical protein